MKIAFISYEYPPDTADGGIATYVSQVARILKGRGHQIEIFAGSNERSGIEAGEDDILVHRVQLDRRLRPRFSETIAPVFSQRHAQVKFDLLEGPELFCDAKEAIRHVPDIPLVITLHGPRFLISKLRACGDILPPSALENNEFHLPTVKHFFRFSARAMRVLRLADQERIHVRQADAIVSPSHGLKNLALKFWQLDPEAVTCIPFPFLASDELLMVKSDCSTNTVTYFGRLEIGKGILDLARAMPVILRERPDTKFCLVGESRESPDPNMNMKEYLQDWLKPFSRSVQLFDKVPSSRLAEILSGTGICVFPSLWENFPFAVREAMAAARAVIGSSCGGAREILDEDTIGRLVPPGRPDKIAERVLELLKDPSLRNNLGITARKQVLARYSPSDIAPLIELNYEKAIKYRRDLGPRADT